MGLDFDLINIRLSFPVGRPALFDREFKLDDGQAIDADIARRVVNREYFKGLTVGDVIVVHEKVCDVGITHNLSKMADAVGLYDPLWEPMEHGWTVASDITEKLKDGMGKLLDMPTAERTRLNPPNGWGNHQTFLESVNTIMQACIKHPCSVIYASR